MSRNRYPIIAFIAAVLLFPTPSLQAEDTSLKFKTEIKQDDKLKLDWVWRMHVQGPYLFVAVHRDSDVIWFKRDKTSGDLTYIATIDLDTDLGHKRHSNPSVVLSNKNILYISGDWTHAHSDHDSLGLSWYQLDPTTGSSRKLGTIPLDAGTIHASDHPDRLYLSAHFKGAIETIVLDPKTGAPTVEKKLTGKGIGSGFVRTRDGKQFYSISKNIVGWGQIAKDGSLAYLGSLDLAVMEPKGGIRSHAVGISPDGRHVYVNLAGYGKKNAAGKYMGYNGLGLFKRDAKTGGLTFVETLETDNNMHKITRMVFRSDGKAGYYSSGPESTGNCMGWFAREQETGRLTFGGVADNSKGKGPGHFDFAPDSGTIYMAGTWSTKSFLIYSTAPDAK